MQRIRLAFARAFVARDASTCIERLPHQVHYHSQKNVLQRASLQLTTAGTPVIAASTRGTATTKNKRRPFHLVIVESPSKCMTISNILNKYAKKKALKYDFIVESCRGHIRDLPKSAKGPKKTAVVGVDVDNNYEATYEIRPGKEELVKKLQTLAEQADKVLLATDGDREGEAIAWHLTQVLETPQERYQRVTFSEITPTAIEHSIQHPTTLNLNLIQAQETRRILDRLVGYTLSPLLWKKIAPGLSAGRVQSVGMALIVQRERERLLFQPVEYWDMRAEFQIKNENINATLVSVNGMLVATDADFDNHGKLVSNNKRHFSEIDTEYLKNTLAGNANETQITTWTVVSVESRQEKESPPMPFNSVTLMEDAVERLGLSITEAMQGAQSLYENGDISYMRTDSTALSQDAHKAAAKMIASDYGKDLVAQSQSREQSANAEEAHEAIRPTIKPSGGFKRPNQLEDRKNEVSLKLYAPIYYWTLASDMVERVANYSTVLIEAVNGDTKAIFRVEGSVVIAPGYTLALEALERSSSDRLLPPLELGQVLNCKDLFCINHSTQPPPRYNEASFVKELEARGVGRPSTYARTIQTLRDRGFVGTINKAKTCSPTSVLRVARAKDFTRDGREPLVPSLSAFVVCSFLEKHFRNYMDPDFTAEMEEQLDQIACGAQGVDRVSLLDEFYAGENGLVARAKYVDKNVAANEARKSSLPTIFIGTCVQQKMSRTKDTTSSIPRCLLSSREEHGELMGVHPDDGRPVTLKLGPFGAFLQWGEEGENKTTTHSLPEHLGNVRPSTDDENDASHTTLSSMIGLTFCEAVGYVNLPRTVCLFNGIPIFAAIGPYGPYLKYNNSFVSLSQTDGDVLTVDAETAERVVTEGIINEKSRVRRLSRGSTHSNE